ncbi:isochorismate synthase [Nocardioides sp.]|uniref:isochorismate synthase n=1 Tax=Nocardioides sp. TaxID=35761 RepID=UPI00262CFDB3|nr:isochorismate synthase [Nocardioides sp.]
MQPSLVVSSHSIPAEHAADLIALLPAAGALSWVRRGEGLVAGGLSAQVETAGPTRFADAAKWWAELVARAEVDDRVGEPGTGLVSFGSFGFAAEPGGSVLSVPRWVIGRRGPIAWLTTITPAGEQPATLERILAEATPVATAPALRVGPGSLSEEDWKARVADATARINAGDLEKVVLARDITALGTGMLDVRGPLAYLAAEYLMCWTFHVDGLFGATPELLVRRERGLVTSRVLAGTIRRTGAAEEDDRLAGELSRSSKDLEEHEYAVRSVADALEPHCSSMNVPEAPFVLHLPNVMHLATDVTGVARDGITSLELAAALHPSAAVGGTPRADAVDLIAEIEGMDRARYAAPVGWMDAAGDGEWGIALRSAAIESGADADSTEGDIRVRLFAGCGVVGSSDPASELAESQAKLVPIRASLGL